MDDFKKVYSNEDTLTKALPYFWENFDPEANSIWYCEYKYPQELTLVFMSCNLIAGTREQKLLVYESNMGGKYFFVVLGMYQRLDKLRKNAFGSMCLFGSDNNSTISGIWIWRGQDLVFPVSMIADYQMENEKSGIVLVSQQPAPPTSPANQNVSKFTSKCEIWIIFGFGSCL